VVLLYVHLLETTFPKLDHDYLFVDADFGSPLKASYLKNYAKKVINGSKYRRDLRNLSNHSFRHRFITLYIAKELKKLAASGSFASILNVAATACRKITMHASVGTLSRYIHLASELNHKTNDLSEALQEVSTQIRIRVDKLLNISESFNVKQINEHQALELMLSNIEELRKLSLS
jgi:integrase